MTEEEAKTKWCPMVRVGQHAFNTHTNGDIPEMANCIASDCMMWMWDIHPDSLLYYPKGSEVEADGHCGLVK